jgi:hypothetical protein
VLDGSEQREVGGFKVDVMNIRHVRRDHSECCRSRQYFWTYLSPLAVAAFIAALLFAGGFGGVGPTSAGTANPIVLENQQPGTTAWRIGQSPYSVADDGNGQIKGYASATSVNKGGQITFNVSVNPAGPYTIDLYRMGCYPDRSGTCLGGRLMTRIGPFDGTTQPPCTMDSPGGGNTGLLECQWSGNAFTVPSNWTSGIYLAVLTNGQNFQNYIQFVVRDDSRNAALLYQQPVATYQAYNQYPYYASQDPRNGKSLYDSASGGSDTVAGVGRRRAVKVSFDRPYAGDGSADLLDPNGWSWEGYFIRWMEKNGYDVSYSTSLDLHESPQSLLRFKGFLSVGHDEYWSKQMFDNAEAARAAGVNLAFFGGNDVYWQVRFEPSSTGTPDRVMVSYKNSPNNSFDTVDPVADPTLRTVRFQDPPVNRSSQTLLGLSFQGSTERSTKNTAFKPVNVASSWIYDGSGYAEGDSTPAVVGYEADRVDCQYPMPNYTSYTLVGKSPFTDIDGFTKDSNAALYQAPSRAWVFASGTMSWSWALDRSTPTPDQGVPNGWVDSRTQNTTKNILDVFSGAKAARPITSNPPDCAEHRVMGFEGGSLTGADGADKVLGGPTLDTTSQITGQGSARFAGVANSYLSTQITAADDLNVAFNLKLNALPTNDVRLLLVTTVFSTTGTLLIRSNGTICLKYGNYWAGGALANSCTTTPLALNTIYRLGLHQIRGTGADGILEGFIAVGNAPFGAPFVRNTTGTWTFRADRVDIGTTTNVPFDAWMDDIKLDGGILTVPAAPSNLAVSSPQDATRVDLTWVDNATNESSYTVARSTTPSFDSPTLTKIVSNSTIYHDTTVQPETTYYYRIDATNAVGSASSSIVSVTTRPTPPAAPTGLVATSLTATSIRLDWVDNSLNETGFTLQRAGDAGFTSSLTLVDLPARTTSYTDNVSSEGVYYYRVKAVNIGTSSTWSAGARGSRIRNITFEDGTPSLINAVSGAEKNASGLVTQESVTPIKGRYSAHVANVTNAYIEQSTGNVDNLYLSFYFRLNVRPTVDHRFAQVLSGQTTIANLWVRTDGTICLKYGNYWSGGSIGAACTPLSKALVVGVSYRLAVRELRGDGTSSAILQGYLAQGDTPFAMDVSGQPVTFASSVVASTSPGYWTTPATTVRLGATLSGPVLDATYDDIELDSAFLPSPSS